MSHELRTQHVKAERPQVSLHHCRWGQGLLPAPAGKAEAQGCAIMPTSSLAGKGRSPEEDASLCGP